MRNQYDSYVTKELEINIKCLEPDVSVPQRNKQRNFRIDLSVPRESRNGLSKDSDGGDDMYSQNYPTEPDCFATVYGKR